MPIAADALISYIFKASVSDNWLCDFADINYVANNEA